MSAAVAALGAGGAQQPAAEQQQQQQPTAAAADVAAAEEALQRGLVERAHELAASALAAAPPLEDAARALSVLVQADFHFHNQLTQLEPLLASAGLELARLPFSVVLLWGVVAVELQETAAARSLLSAYLSGNDNFRATSADVSREDALALSRLYAVQLLAGLCHDFDAAVDWLCDGGAGLSEEQQQLLLAEVDEAEELLNEEQLDNWAATHAAAAVGEPPGSIGGGAEQHAPLDPHGAPRRGSHAVDGASVVSGHSSLAQELGPSASGALSDRSSLHPAGSRELDPQLAGEAVGDAAAAAGDEAAAAAAAGLWTPPLHMAVAATAAAATAAADGDASIGPASPSLGAWRPSDEAAVQDQDQDMQLLLDSSPYVTLTGGLEELAGLAEGGPPAAANPSKTDSGRSTSAGRQRKAGDSCAALAAAAASAAAMQQPAQQQASQQQPPQQEQQEQQVPRQQLLQQQQQQHQQQPWLDGYAEWLHGRATVLSSRASELWASPRVQDTLAALNLQDVPPWQLAGGASVVALLAWGAWRRRRGVKRAAAAPRARLAS